MYQITRSVDTEHSLDSILAELAQSDAYANCASKLLMVFEPNCDYDSFCSEAATVRAALPQADVVGMTTLGPTNPNLRTPQGTVVTLLAFKESAVTVVSYDCHDQTPLQAGENFVAVMDKIENPQGVLFMSSDVSLWPAPFIDRISEAFPHVPVFGEQAGATHLAVDQSLVMCNGDVLDRGILAVVFSGESLSLQTEYNMGFRPLGRELAVTQSEAEGYVVSIDGQPAASIYRKYLNVVPDEFFYDNVCSFPLLRRSKRWLIPHVPLESTKDGKLKFSMEIPVDTKLMLSYSKPEYLLRESLASANRMADFGPQALMLFVCINRRVFMGNDGADEELSFYENACRNMCWAYGFGEILQTEDGGGLMNSTLVAVAFREGQGERFLKHAHAPFEEEERSSIPLADRLVTFLEATTAELRDTIDELAVLAQRDMLTGLYNRRRIDELINVELSKLKHGDSIVLLMYDIDHFKRINDTYGHEVGDIVLKDLTKRVNEVIRSKDALGRWGGEEFLCLVTDASLDQARGLAERIRRHVEETDFYPVGRVTVSIGVTVANFEDSVDSLFGRVDQALYDAKNSGRNRVCIR